MCFANYYNLYYIVKNLFPKKNLWASFVWRIISLSVFPEHPYRCIWSGKISLFVPIGNREWWDEVYLYNTEWIINYNRYFRDFLKNYIWKCERASIQRNILRPNMRPSIVARVIIYAVKCWIIAWKRFFKMETKFLRCKSEKIVTMALQTPKMWITWHSN